MAAPLWQPPPDARSTTRLGSFIDFCESRSGLTFDGYEDLRSWSVGAGLEDCWAAVWDFFDVQSTHAVRARRQRTRDARCAAGSKGARLNYAEHALRPGLCATTTSPSWRSRRAAAGFADLGRARRSGRSRPCRAAAARRRGTVIASPPTCPTSPRRSSPSWRRPASGRRGRRALPSSACRRCSTASRRSSRRCCSPSRATATARATVVAQRRAGGDPGGPAERCGRRSSCRTPTVRDGGRGDGRGTSWSATPAPLEFAAGRARPSALRACTRRARPGCPKPIVHGHGGILLEHLKVLGLHGDMGAADRFFWFTTTGWMMWNYLVSGLLRRRALGAVRRRSQPRRASTRCGSSPPTRA